MVQDGTPVTVAAGDGAMVTDPDGDMATDLGADLTITITTITMGIITIIIMNLPYTDQRHMVKEIMAEVEVPIIEMLDLVILLVNLMVIKIIIDLVKTDHLTTAPINPAIK